MKKTIINSFLILGCVPLFGQVINIGSGNDIYWGGDPSNSGTQYAADVIGDPAGDVFELYRWNVDYNLSNEDVSVSITGEYFQEIINNTTTGPNRLLNTTLGDLFISTNGLGWDFDDPSAAEAATLDDWSNTATASGRGTSTVWDYAIKVTQGDNSDGNIPTTGPATPNTRMYEINNGSIELSDASGIFREFQEHTYTPGNDDDSFDASWWVTNDSIEFVFNLDDLGQLTANNALGFHWTMSCGNDVIEWEIPLDVVPQGVVPEPSTYAALGLGTLLSLVYLRRRRAQKKA